MKKFLIRLLMVIGSIVLTILLVYLVLLINGSSGKYKEEPVAASEKWMDYIEDDTLLKDIAIPGSHDAMTTGMYYMARTQNADTSQSLLMGIRYFDLRVNLVDDTLKIYHSIINGVELKPCLETMKEFLEEHPTETLILDFQHFKNDSQEKTYEMIHEVFDTTMIIDKKDSTLSDLEYVASLTLSDSRGKILVLWGDYSYFSLANDYTDLFPRDKDSCSYGTTACISYYDEVLHKKSSKEFIEECLPVQFDLARSKEEDGTLALFVLQSQLTDGKYIFGPYAREKTHDKNMSAYVRSLYDSEDISLVNIIMRDFMNNRKCGEIIILNEAKGIIKEEYKEIFSDYYSVYR